MSQFCSALIGVIVTALFVWLTHVREAVPRKEMQAAVKEAESKFFAVMKANNSILQAMQGDVNQLKIDVAVLKKDADRHNGRGAHA